MSDDIDPNNPPAPEAPPAPAQPATPPRAAAVVNGGKTQRELELEAKLEEERQERKKEQLTIMELQDQNRQLKEPRRPSVPRPKKVPATFFHDMD